MPCRFCVNTSGFLNVMPCGAPSAPTLDHMTRPELQQTDRITTETPDNSRILLRSRPGVRWPTLRQGSHRKFLLAAICRTVRRGRPEAYPELSVLIRDYVERPLQLLISTSASGEAWAMPPVAEFVNPQVPFAHSTMQGDDRCGQTEPYRCRMIEHGSARTAIVHSWRRATYQYHVHG